MKKIVIVLTGLLVACVINAQTLDEIVKKYSSAMKTDKLVSISSIKVSGKVSAMGMELPLVMTMKNPNKIRVTYSLNGQDMVTAFDGEKGYAINPMTGSTEPVEITGEQLKQVQNQNAFRNELLDYFKEGKLTLEGEENINGNAAHKLKAESENGPVMMFIDKASYRLVKTSAKVDRMGTMMDVDSYMTDYVDIEGVVMPKKITQMANGEEAAVITFENIEVNIPIDDSVFKLK